jgi:nucleoside-diphosphate-sugar epimerase
VNTARPVLVTGGTGFIGRALVAVLRAQGTPVRVVVRRADRADAVAALGAEAIIGDLCDPTVVPRAIAGVGAVYHLAGRLFSPGEPAREYERLHVDATEALLTASVAAGDLDFFLLCSTTGVHGATGSRLPREDDPGQPTNAYEATKARAESIASEMAKRHGLKAVIARPGLVYGPGDRHLLGLFRAIRGGYYRVIGSGGNRFHPIFIDDLIRGLILAASAAGRDCRAYHLVGPRPVTMRELSDAIGNAVGRPVPKAHLPRPLALALGGAFEVLPLPRRMLPLTRSRVRFMTQDRAYDGSRARRELGFVTEVELDEGMARTVSWYRNNHLL